jgi:FKBP-type peptidyl-prolyl cis-trans isomerase SlyD
MDCDLFFKVAKRMQIADKHVVSMNYTLKDDQGTVLDTSENRDVLKFIVGAGMIIPGLEKELHGKEKGDKLSVTVEPKDAYGEYDESQMITVSKSQFQEGLDIKTGMQVQAQSQDGQVQILTIKDVDDDNVTLDANHPLAGQTLHFDVQIEDVRDASEEELSHGHVH